MEMTRDRSVLFAGLSTQHGCVNSSSHFGGDLNVLGDHLASVPAAAAWKISGDLLPLRAEEQVNDRRDWSGATEKEKTLPGEPSH